MLHCLQFRLPAEVWDMKKLLFPILVILMLAAGCIRIVSVPSSNELPIAYIDSIFPTEAPAGETVFFDGHGTDAEGDVVAYSWRSSIDGDLSTTASFATSSLSAGVHTIYLSVQDDDGDWSEEVESSVTVSGEAGPPARAPTINSFTASPGSIPSGGSSTLTWNVFGARRVSIDHGLGNVALAGTRTVSPGTTTTYTLTATNEADTVTARARVTVSGAPPPPPPPVSPPVISFFTANPGSITTGNSSMLSWIVSDANTVTITHGSSVTPVSSVGSAAATPPTTTTYTITATNTAGSVTKTVQVVVGGGAPPGLPVISFFTASPGSITLGASSTLSWGVSGATTVSINQGVGGVTPSGTRVVSPAATTTYTLTATNAAGSVTQPVQVVVSGAPPPSLSVINSFTASPGSITLGASSTLSWSVSGATTVSINQGVGSVASSGTTVVWPATTATYTLTATNAAGSVTQPVQVVVSGGGGGGSALEQALFDEVNSRRVGAGLPALTRNAILDQLCRDHSAYMVAAGMLSHDGFTPRCTQAQTQIGAMACGENVLEAPESWSASQIVDLWQGSPGHWANIINPAFARAGMGIVISGGQVYATQFFTD